MSNVNAAAPRVAQTTAPTQPTPPAGPEAPHPNGDQAGTPVQCRGIRDGGSPEALRACLQKFAEVPGDTRLATGIAPRQGRGVNT